MTIGSKVKVYIAGRFIYRTLQDDSQGLFIRLSNQRVPVRIDPHNQAYYLAIKPK